MSAPSHAELADPIAAAARELEDQVPAASPPVPGSIDYDLFLAKMLAALRVASAKRLSEQERLMVSAAKQDVLDQMHRRRA